MEGTTCNGTACNELCAAATSMCVGVGVCFCLSLLVGAFSSPPRLSSAVSSAMPGPTARERVSCAHDLRVQISRMALGEMPYLPASCAAVAAVLVLRRLKMCTACSAVNLHRSPRSGCGSDTCLASPTPPATSIPPADATGVVVSDVVVSATVYRGKCATWCVCVRAPGMEPTSIDGSAFKSEPTEPTAIERGGSTCISPAVPSR
mmetsp:Transcript_18263/g.29164  ORF Transcript_18263/g.29164 Transcript_18263/m.29164 type:complete len:205 (-) Transcript_18263:162-776(-)